MKNCMRESRVGLIPTAAKQKDDKRRDKAKGFGSETAECSYQLCPHLANLSPSSLPDQKKKERERRGERECVWKWHWDPLSLLSLSLSHSFSLFEVEKSISFLRADNNHISSHKDITSVRIHQNRSNGK